METQEKETQYELTSEEADALQMIIEEYLGAVKKFGGFNSAHEGFAVLQEEVDELWEEVRKKQGNREDLAKEAKQVAAMGLRFLVEVCLKNERFN